MPFRYLSIVFIVLILHGCGKPPAGGEESNGYSFIPEAVFIEREISGPFFDTYLDQPYGIVSLSDGHIAVVDRGNDRLLLLDSTFSVIAESPGYGLSGSYLNHPAFVAVDFFGNIAVADEGNARVAIFDPRLVLMREQSTRRETDQNSLDNPVGLAIVGTDLWVGDSENDILAIYDIMGTLIKTIGEFGYEGGGVNSPQKILELEGQHLLVCDAENNRLIWYDQDGRFQRDADYLIGQFPVAAAIHRDNLWVLDGVSGEIAIYNDDGDLLMLLGGTLPGTTKPLTGPTDIISLDNDRMLISDTGNNRLLILKVLYPSPLLN